MKNIDKIINEFLQGSSILAYKKISDYVLENPLDIKARYNMAIMEQKLGYIERAIKNYVFITTHDHEHVSALNNLYLLHFKIKKYKQAIIIINKLLIKDSKNCSWIRDKALAMFSLKKSDEALNLIISSLEINPKDYVAYNIKALILISLKKYTEAFDVINKGLLFNKNYYPLINTLGTYYNLLNQNKEAYLCFIKANQINSNAFEPINNLAGHYMHEGNYNEALKFYMKANEIKPNNIAILGNIGKLYSNLDEDKKAEKYFLKTLKIDANNDANKKAYSIFLFKKKNYKKAWDLFDGRLGLNEFIIKNSYLENVKKYLWDGKKINPNSKILIIREQGVGDEILYGTMYPDFLQKFKNVVIESDIRMISIFNRSLNIKDDKIFVPLGTNIKIKKNLKKFDIVIYAGSLGKILRNKLNDFPSKHYLKENPKLYNLMKKKLDDISKNPKIGLSWKSFKNQFDVQKSISLKKLLPLLRLQNLDFINLQYGNVTNDIEEINKNKNKNILTIKEIDLFNDFESVAALLKNLDLFITVSNSTAHLAGSLGVKTLLIKPPNHCAFHYWNQSGEKTPWYSSVKIISSNNGIGNVINKITNEIKKIKN